MRHLALSATMPRCLVVEVQVLIAMALEARLDEAGFEVSSAGGRSFMVSVAIQVGPGHDSERSWSPVPRGHNEPTPASRAMQGAAEIARAEA